MLARSGSVRFAVLGLLLLVVLTGCYVPDNFFCEIRLSRTGDYALSYKGDLIWAPLYSDIREDKLSRDQMAEKTKMVLEDLKRDKAFKSVERNGTARFRVDYDLRGRLAATQQVNFLRRNANMLAITATQTGQVIIQGVAFSAIQAREAMRLGLATHGEFRIVTDGNVKEHNASSVRPFGSYRVYIWRMENVLSPAPRFIMERANV